MSPEDSTPAQRAPLAAVSKNVTLSPWVNKQFPAWEQLLSAHHVARLTRPRWMLLGMMTVGRFPRTLKFHGRAIGWLRNDVLDWVAQHSKATTRDMDNAMPISRRRFARQPSIPLRCSAPCAARRSRAPCVERTRRLR
jgi:predicted DNA-binding transcriptional regulator AlpA